MAYRLEQDQAKQEPFSGYSFRIFAGDRMIARYWHDHRGDEHVIEFADGRKEVCPLGRTTDFFEGGGPEPLSLTARAVAYLDRLAT